MTYRECFAYGVEALEQAGIADARIDAGLLLEFVCHISRHELLLYGNREVDAADEALYKAYIAKRGKRIPLQHITGEQSFMGFDYAVNEHVLIPRQDTEILVEEALKLMKPGMRVLDMCTGSGCILLSMLALSKECEGLGVDISSEALRVARQNQARVEAQCGKSLSAEFIESDLFAEFSIDAEDKEDYGKIAIGLFDMIVSNPPYIASAIIDTLEPEVRLHEPMGALDGTADGLYFYRKIVTESRTFLKKGGMLLFEIGHDQGEMVPEFMKAAGFTEVAVKKDYAGLDRIVYGYYEEEA